MKIFAAHDGGSGCAWYRMILPMQELARHGYEVTLGSGSTDHGEPGLTRSRMTGHDVVVGQRFNKPGGVHVYRELRTPSTRLVYELDDDVFHVTAENFTAYKMWQRPDILDAAIHAMQVSDLVTCTTPQLAEVLSEHNPNVAVIPNRIPGWVCDYDRKRRDRPAIGWAGGASHGADIGIVAPHIRRFMARFPGWDFRLGGTDYRPTVKTERALYTPWVHVSDNPEGFYTYPDWDIGLAPVVPTRFNASKSPLKALEYAALGIPVIASAFGPYPDFVRHGETGFLVRHDHEWLKYMSELASDEGLREKMGAAAREQARQWTIEDGWTQWRDAYEGLF